MIEEGRDNFPLEIEKDPVGWAQFISMFWDRDLVPILVPDPDNPGYYILKAKPSEKKKES